MSSNRSFATSNDKKTSFWGLSSDAFLDTDDSRVEKSVPERAKSKKHDVELIAITWRYFRYAEKQELLKDLSGLTLRYCKWCPWSTSRCREAQSHLRERHSVDVQEERSRQVNNRDEVTTALVNLISEQNLTLETIKWQEIEYLLLTVNPKVGHVLPESRNDAIERVNAAELLLGFSRGAGRPH
jgi:hypothetical protein